MEETNSDSNHDEVKLALVVQLIAVIGVVTEPGTLSIAVIGVGQWQGRQRKIFNDMAPVETVLMYNRH